VPVTPPGRSVVSQSMTTARRGVSMVRARVAAWQFNGQHRTSGTAAPRAARQPEGGPARYQGLLGRTEPGAGQPLTASTRQAVAAASMVLSLRCSPVPLPLWPVVMAWSVLSSRLMVIFRSLAFSATGMISCRTPSR